jgi:hypothetical protein
VGLLVNCKVVGDNGIRTWTSDSLYQRRDLALLYALPGVMWFSSLTWQDTSVLLVTKSCELIALTVTSHLSCRVPPGPAIPCKVATAGRPGDIASRTSWE